MSEKFSKAMFNEIAEESKIIRKILKEKDKYTSDFVNLFKTHEIKRIYIVGNGSPGWASVALKYAAVKILKADTSYSTPMLFLNHEGFDPGKIFAPEEMLLLCPAESGRTVGPVLIARDAKAKGIPVVCTTLEPDGVLAEASDVVISKPSGREYGLPSTKGHSTGIFLFLLNFVEAAYATGKITAEEYDRYSSAFRKLPDTLEDAASATLDWFKRNMNLLMASDRIHYVAYGANFSTIKEATLKGTETHRKPSFADELENFLHGPVGAIESREIVFMIAAEDCPEKDRMLRLYHILKEKKVGRDCILVHSTADAFSTPNELAFAATNVEFVNCLEYLLPFQLLTYCISEHLGIDTSFHFGEDIENEMGTSIGGYMKAEGME